MNYQHLIPFNSHTAKRDRMFCYLWHRSTKLEICKFGERWVFSGENAVEECEDRVRESVGVDKDDYDDGEIIIDALWDVTEYAKKVGRYKKGGHVDDSIRQVVPSVPSRNGRCSRRDTD